jgi:hypothetical protein
LLQNENTGGGGRRKKFFWEEKHIYASSTSYLHQNPQYEKFVTQFVQVQTNEDDELYFKYYQALCNRCSMMRRRRRRRRRRICRRKCFLNNSNKADSMKKIVSNKNYKVQRQ